eukprot:354551-Chlamydomonas_euryale.AAC.20
MRAHDCKEEAGRLAVARSRRALCVRGVIREQQPRGCLGRRLRSRVCQREVWANSKSARVREQQRVCVAARSPGATAHGVDAAARAKYQSNQVLR